MTTNKKLPDNQITVYQAPDGKINIEVLYANENIWLPQKRMAKLFDVGRSIVTKLYSLPRSYKKIQYVQILHILPRISL